MQWNLFETGGQHSGIVPRSFRAAVLLLERKDSDTSPACTANIGPEIQQIVLGNQEPQKIKNVKDEPVSISTPRSPPDNGSLGCQIV
ncbi:uncharacterized protein PV07_08806 [Cladophialophora immunda]|uniref:Uncharacterized protein n=1 Tax=Cladophialophora immunda TaxID=569365 RepID=A0A0D2C595_9EURO|nr:uncharacterized protein PV07_08806 [Cladophialophora immunda]KIW25640.1 hypothetical protein PV07_08806 [Cladophialophora immunda]